MQRKLQWSFNRFFVINNKLHQSWTNDNDDVIVINYLLSKGGGEGRTNVNVNHQILLPEDVYLPKLRGATIK